MQRRQFLKAAAALTAITTVLPLEPMAAEVKEEGVRVWGNYVVHPLRPINTKDGVTKVKVGGHECHFNTLEEFETWVKVNTWDLLNLTVAIGGPYNSNSTLQQLWDKYAGINSKTQLTVELYSEEIPALAFKIPKTDERHSVTLRPAKELTHSVTVKMSDEIPLLKKPMYYNVRNAYLPRVSDAA